MTIIIGLHLMNPTDLSSLEVFFLIAVMMKATSTVKIQAFIVHSGLFCCFLDAEGRPALGHCSRNKEVCNRGVACSLLKLGSLEKPL